MATSRRIFTVIGIAVVVALGCWYYFTQVHEYNDFEPAPTDPDELKAYEIGIFREYLRIPSMHPNIDYKPCIAFLKRQARSLDLPINVYYPVHDKSPMVVMTWTGSQPELPSIVLNSHMDVVPVYADQWTHPPFAAEMDAEGRIFGRGAQDMKSSGIQYLAAIRALRQSGVHQFNRTIHIMFAADEEIGGTDGWKAFVRTDDFKAMNVEFVLDEARATETSECSVIYGERANFATVFEITGESGHGSLILPNTAGRKARFIIDKMFDFRDAEEQRLKSNPNLTMADVTTINWTVLKGGVQHNVVPRDITLTFDIRVPINVNLLALKQMFERWGREAGEGITVYQKYPNSTASVTPIGEKNPFYMALRATADQMNFTLVPKMTPGASDGRHIREVNVPVLGFSTMSDTPVLLHCNDEYITDKVFLRGIEIYKVAISNLAQHST